MPSGSSLAVTYPGLFGSRVGGMGRSACCAGERDWLNRGLAIVITVSRTAILRNPGSARMERFCGI